MSGVPGSAKRSRAQESAHCSLLLNSLRHAGEPTPMREDAAVWPAPPSVRCLIVA